MATARAISVTTIRNGKRAVRARCRATGDRLASTRITTYITAMTTRVAAIAVATAMEKSVQVSLMAPS